jgi:hypothetical protein
MQAKTWCGALSLLVLAGASSGQAGLGAGAGLRLDAMGLGDAGVRARSGDGLWAVLESIPAVRAAQPAYIRPDRFMPAALDLAGMSASLAQSPSEEAYLFGGAAPVLVELPMPDGTFDLFTVYSTPIMSPGLAAKFPGFATYAGPSVSDPTAQVRITVTSLGFDAMVMRAGPDVFIDRYSAGDTGLYTSYYAGDVSRPGHEWTCSFDADAAPRPGMRGEEAQRPAALSALPPVTFRTFQTAVSATGEYTQNFGGTVAGGQAAIVTAMNRVSGVYERDLGARLQLVPNNDLIVYTNPSTDPYPSSVSLGTIDSTIDTVIGSANYDIGHLVDTGAGGFAQLAVVCTTSKGAGYTGLTPPTGDPFYIDYVAHEMGHQFGGNHSFNGDSGSCAGGNRNGSTAYEIGSATTIMGYAGICGNDDVQNNSDDYFHWISLQEMSAHIASRTCDSESASGNNTPTVEAGPNWTVPVNTPFRLTATGSDIDGDTLTYTWEQANLGPQQDAVAPDNGSSPLFRSFEGTTNPTRSFPSITDWRDGALLRGEKFALTARTLTFRVTARDNNPAGGGYAVDSTNVVTTTSAGPFRVTSQSTPTTITNGQMTVTWNVANTNAIPLLESSVNILFSTDDGLTFPFVLASGTPNDGSEVVTLPGVTTTTGRVMVEAAANIFFDLNKARITVDVPPEPVSFSFPGGVPTELDEGEPTTFQVSIDPGTQTLQTGSGLLFYGFDTTALFLTTPLVPLGGELYEATIPAGTCDQLARFYLLIPDTGGVLWTSPEDELMPYEATVVCVPPVCVADVNGDGMLSPADFSSWVSSFNAQGPGCDQNADGLCTAADFSSWISNFNAGCP